LARLKQGGGHRQLNGTTCLHRPQWKTHLRPIVAADGTGAAGLPLRLEQAKGDWNACLSTEDCWPCWGLSGLLGASRGECCDGQDCGGERKTVFREKHV
jgi:hypothetical protein